ncbi:unnamed protein product, partial [Prorocentrum cordatum]
VGYAFVSFRDPAECALFVSQFHGASSAEMLPGFNSKKVCQVSPARHQGCKENVRRLQASPVMAELARNPEWLPRWPRRSTRMPRVVHRGARCAQLGDAGSLMTRASQWSSRCRAAGPPRPRASRSSGITRPPAAGRATARP